MLAKFSDTRFRSVPRACWSDEDILVVGACGWTAIFDPLLVLPNEWEACRAISAMGTDVVAAAWETVSASFVFSLYRNGVAVRELSVTDGVVRSRGEPLPGERPPMEMTVHDVMSLVEQAAVPLDVIKAAEGVLHFEREYAQDENELDVAEVSAHWAGILRLINLAVTEFPDQERSTVTRVIGCAEGPEDRAWDALAGALGLTDAVVGERRTVGGGDAPALAGVVEWASDSSPHLLLRIEEPAPGYVLVGVFSHDGQVHCCLDLRLFGDGAQEIAAREEPRWRAWMEAHFPSVGST